jgi:hypothetical protein
VGRVHRRDRKTASSRVLLQRAVSTQKRWIA